MNQARISLQLHHSSILSYLDQMKHFFTITPFFNPFIPWPNETFLYNYTILQSFHTLTFLYNYTILQSFHTLTNISLQLHHSSILSYLDQHFFTITPFFNPFIPWPTFLYNYTILQSFHTLTNISLQLHHSSILSYLDQHFFTITPFFNPFIPWPTFLYNYTILQSFHTLTNISLQLHHSSILLYLDQMKHFFTITPFFNPFIPWPTFLYNYTILQSFHTLTNIFLQLHHSSILSYLDQHFFTITSFFNPFIPWPNWNMSWPPAWIATMLGWLFGKTTGMARYANNNTWQVTCIPV